jgi:hypothetical protein
MQSHEYSSKPGRRRSRSAGLIALNAALLGVLALVSLAPDADAQVARTRGQYLMVGGHVNGVDGAAVFVIDSRNQEMMALALNNTSKNLDGIGYRNLANDSRSLPGGRGN